MFDEDTPTEEDVLTAEKLKELSEAAERSAEKRAEYLSKIRALSIEEAEALKARLSSERNIVNLLEQQIEKQKALGQGAEDQLAAAKRYLEVLEDTNIFIGRENLMAQARLDVQESAVRVARKKLETTRQDATASGKDVLAAQKALNKEEKKLKIQTRRTKERFKAQQELEATVAPLTKTWDEMSDSMHDLKHGNADMLFRFANDFTQTMKKASAQITGGFDFSVGGLFEHVLKLGLELDAVATNFARTTRLAGKFNDVLDTTIESSMKLGASMADAAEANKALITTVTDFTFASEVQATRLAKTTTLMTRFGISSQTTAENMQASMKIFSQSFEGADATMYELIDTAEALGVLPEELAGQFGKMSGSLAKLGSEGVDAFKELARVAKITGMEMEKILQITDKFDTFEGAAEQVGKINAALGGNFVNAMDLMMATDPSERFQTIRDAIMSTGLTFDSMSYYQRKFFAESMGLADVGDLALMMSGNMNALGDATNMTSADYEKLAEEAATMQGVQDKFNTTMAEFFMENKDEIMDFIEKIRTLLEFVMKHIDTWSDWIKFIVRAKLVMFLLSGAAAALKITLTLLSFSQLAAVPATVAQTIATKGLAVAFMELSLGARWAVAGLGIIAVILAVVAAAMMFGSPSQLVIAVFALGAAIFFLGRMSDASVASVQAMAIPLLQVGAALFIAAAGLGLMALGFSLLDGSEMLMIAVAISAIATALYFLAPSLAGVGTASIAVSPGLAIFAAAVISVGVAVGIAAAGLGLMAWGFSLLDGSEMLLVAIAIISIATALYYLIPGLTGIGSVSVAVSPGLAIFAAVMISIGLAVGIAAAGIGYMASSLATMFNAINAEKITLFGTFVASLIGAAPMMLAAAGGLFELGLGMTAFGLGLSFASEDKLRSVADFATGLAGLEVGALEALGEALEKVAAAMEKIPDSKAVALTATMRTAAVAAAAVEALGGTGGGGGRGAGGARGTKRSNERTRPFEVKFILDGEVFERKVIKIYETEDGKYHAEAVRNER